MSSIGAVCDSLGKTFLTLLLGNLGATGKLRVNSSPVKLKLIIFPLFLPQGTAIFPMTAKEACDIVSTVTKAALVAIVDMIPLDTKVYIIPTVV